MAVDRLANSGSNAKVPTNPVAGHSESLPKVMPISREQLAKNKVP